MRLGTRRLLVVYHNRVLEDEKTTGVVSSLLVINWGCFVESSSRVENDPAPPATATLPDLPRIVVFGRQAEKAEPCSSGSAGPSPAASANHVTQHPCSVEQIHPHPSSVPSQAVLPNEIYQNIDNGDPRRGEKREKRRLNLHLFSSIPF